MNYENNIKCVLNLMPSGDLRQVVALQRISLLRKSCKGF